MKRFIDAAMKALDQNKVNGYIIVRFIDKIIEQLDLFSPEKKDVRQESNIQTAKIICNNIKKQMLHHID